MFEVSSDFHFVSEVRFDYSHCFPIIILKRSDKCCQSIYECECLLESRKLFFVLSSFQSHSTHCNALVQDTNSGHPISLCRDSSAFALSMGQKANQKTAQLGRPVF